MTIELKGIGKVTASKEVLNLIAIWAGQAAESYEVKGLNALKRQATEADKEIYDALDKTGYYNN